ncbi:hypothetical protein MEN41_08730 [Dolichospermum sp. ST_con]|nr:hypothetical protein [Dolichospermum sp. DET66]MBS3031068.1 hypothetical protein [Dolichospermum sp. DET67]MBS3036278.1 hypothetical protein [Dolichospermum sp. DET50]MDD1414717.1 hypothetical protein [Dolichospermum sp. ST_con]MDD1418931.1 hypothetical protein [Dolichospermum sp. ST_sed1]MDD1424694.1 hypothetical protein [Dolichospermum sp. ST_sed9]MDD1431142.1 hypothetical protein [Dolichospermum sp. ST_sed6]MDD1437570.1 hypothetical protein [Dolichospermum sp. ST_sed10]MDD1440587.1 hy
MQVQELLQLVDEAVYLNTGNHLNDLQRGVIEGTLKYQKYADIAENCGCSAGHAKDVGYELLKMLSDIFDEPVDKSNLKSVLERQGNVNISLGDNHSNNIFGKGNIKVSCKQPKTKLDKNNSSNSKLKQRKNNKTQIEKIDKLRYFGLNDEQIAEVLELPLEVIKQVESDII